MSTITSPVFSEVVIVLQDWAVRDVRPSQHILFGSCEVYTGWGRSAWFFVWSLGRRSGECYKAVEKLYRCGSGQRVVGLLPLPTNHCIVSNTQATGSSEWEGLRA